MNQSSETYNGSCILSFFFCIIAYGNYDYIEYAGIWVIAIVMTIWGMTSALIAGVIAALSTYAVQVSNSGTEFLFIQ